MSKKGSQAQRTQGMVNRAQGKLFEERIDAALAYYDRLGLASVEKTPEPMRPLKRLSEGRFVAVFEKPAQPDYKGTLQGGRAVVFEAKHTTTGQMEQSRVTEAQAKRLEHHQELGALCFVVAGVRLRGGVPGALEGLAGHESRFRPEICDPQGSGGVPGAPGPVRGAAASGAGDVEIKADTEAACSLTGKRESTIISLTDN